MARSKFYPRVWNWQRNFWSKSRVWEATSCQGKFESGEEEGSLLGRAESHICGSVLMATTGRPRRVQKVQARHDTRRSEDHVRESTCSFHTCPRNRTRVVGLGCKTLYPLSPLAGPTPHC